MGINVLDIRKPLIDKIGCLNFRNATTHVAVAFTWNWVLHEIAIHYDSLASQLLVASGCNLRILVMGIKYRNNILIGFFAFLNSVSLNLGRQTSQLKCCFCISMHTHQDS